MAGPSCGGATRTSGAAEQPAVRGWCHRGLDSTRIPRRSIDCSGAIPRGESRGHADPRYAGAPQSHDPGDRTLAGHIVDPVRRWPARHDEIASGWSRSRTVVPFAAEDVIFFPGRGVRREGRHGLRRRAASWGDSGCTSPHSIPIRSSSRFPEVFAPGVRILHDVPILPRPVLDARLKDGTFAGAWGVATPPRSWWALARL